MLLAPSILAANLADLKSAVELCERGGADLVHFDVMDGRFVPNLTFGAPVAKALADHTDLPLDVHLMVVEPDKLLDDFLEAGAKWLSIHWEAATHLDRSLHRIREAGAQAGVVLNPATPIEVLTDILPETDFVLLMSVNPGFAGQPFLSYVVDKARRLSAEVRRRGLETRIAMDGGIGLGNVRQVVQAGVEVCIAGSAVFAAADPVETMRELRLRAETEVA
jgi:ribulose-phosphate 3-epimerase